MDKINIKTHNKIISRIFCEIISSLYMQKTESELIFDNEMLKKIYNEVLDHRIIFCKRLLDLIDRGIIND
jgi:hypothetical protein